MSTTVTNISQGTAKKVYAVEYPISRVTYRQGSVRVNQSLPFRVSLFNVGISNYGPSSPAPIGIAIIGFNNYIL
jgi:hypothetical protein